MRRASPPPSVRNRGLRRPNKARWPEPATTRRPVRGHNDPFRRSLRFRPCRRGRRRRAALAHAVLAAPMAGAFVPDALLLESVRDLAGHVVLVVLGEHAVGRKFARRL